MPARWPVTQDPAPILVTGHVQPGTRADERRLKQHSAARRCPVGQTELEERRRDQAAENTSQAGRPGDFPGVKKEAGRDTELEAG